jgi:hypothetical protein
MKETLAIIAAVLAIIGNVSYLKDVWKGRVEPHPYTWLVWSIVSMTTFFGGLAKGAGIGALPTGVAEGFTIIIFLFSLKHLFKGTAGHIRKIDNYFLAVCLLGLIPWALTKDPTISVVIVVLIDIIAFIPTLRKTWTHPDTEKPLLYEMNVVRHILTLFSLQSYNIATMFHSIAMICTNTVMTAFIKRRKS